MNFGHPYTITALSISQSIASIRRAQEATRYRSRCKARAQELKTVETPQKSSSLSNHGILVGLDHKYSWLERGFGGATIETLQLQKRA